MHSNVILLLLAFLSGLCVNYTSNFKKVKIGGMVRVIYHHRRSVLRSLNTFYASNGSINTIGIGIHTGIRIGIGIGIGRAVRAEHQFQCQSQSNDSEV